MRNLSASCIAAVKACPTRYRLGYHEGIRPDKDSPPLRVGTNYHEGLSNLRTVGWEAAFDALNVAYRPRPDNIELADWLVERETIAAALAAWNWLHPGEELEVLGTEIPFEVPLVNPETGRASTNWQLVGKIDLLARLPNGQIVIVEYKSTSKPINSDSSYWNRLRLDTQNRVYLVAARQLQAEGKLPGVAADDPLVSGVLHDVWHKPGISPKMLTQAESATFANTGEYCEGTFTVAIREGWAEGPEGTDALVKGFGVVVDGEFVEVEYGKKPGTFAIRETPAMYGARLLQDMYTRPEFYFATRPVAYTDQDLERFRGELWAIQKTLTEMANTGNWYTNEFSCEASFVCPYTGICYHNLALDSLPAGFKQTRGNLTAVTE